MIEIRNLTKWYGRVLAVDDLTFDVPAGKVTGFLGPNGAGKSTTLKILTCYLPASSGSVKVDGLDVLSDSLAVRRLIGYMPEHVPLPGDMRVREYLTYRAGLRDIPTRERRNAVDRAGERCWLTGPEDMMNRRIDQLSRGYRQRVGLADVLLHDPKVLVLDEPTIGLDPAQIRDMRRLITELGSDHTVILSSHILAEVEQTCDQLVIIAGGKLAAKGSAQELRQQVAAGSKIVVEVKTDTPDALAAELKTIEGVVDITMETAGSWQRLVLNVETDVRARVGEMLTGKGLTIRELRRESGSLEDFFVQITYRQSLQTLAETELTPTS
jgi:ABC-2 type transport system ATP-binding protein